MYLTALIITIIGWLFQLYKTVVNKEKAISPVLPLAYAVACLLFGINSFIDAEMLYGILDIICAVVAVVIFIVLLTKKN
jgi:uncharacterized protein with PQ loop repeat